MSKYKHIRTELRALTHNKNVIALKLKQGTLSAAGSIAAEELIKTLSKVKSYIKENRDPVRVDAIVSKLPLLYFQIPKIN